MSGPPRASLPVLAEPPGGALPTSRRDIAEDLKARGIPREARKPAWLKVPIAGGERYQKVRDTLRGLALHTVCQEAHCPNVGECWSGGTATVMLMGDVCTRGLPLLPREDGRAPAAPRSRRAAPPRGGDRPARPRLHRRDERGPRRPARTAAPPTSPTRSVRLKEIPGLLVEVLTPDFRGDAEAVRIVGRAGPDVFANNIETVRRLTPAVRDPRAGLRPDARRARPHEARSSRRSSPSPRSWSVSARPRPRCSRRCATSAARASTSSRSASTCGRARGTCRWWSG